MRTERPSLCGYRILRVLGRGGQGTVYLAEHEVLHKHFAIKYAAGADRAQLRREAAVMKELTDRRIPYLVDQIETEEVSVLVMEYVEGVGLGDYLRERVPLEEDEALRILQQITGIAAYLHGMQGIVAHRDLKPDNFVMAKDGSIHLLDFGCALSGIESLRRKDLCGTPGYAAPEQLRGRRSGTEADVYAIGSIYSYMLTGIDPVLPPFHPAGAEACRETVSLESRRLLRAMLDPAPEKRPQDAVKLLAELEKVQNRKRHLLQELEGLLYQTALAVDVAAAVILVWLRYRQMPFLSGERICGIVTVLLLLWHLLRDAAGAEDRFVIAREWNVTYTAKGMWGL